MAGNIYAKGTFAIGECARSGRKMRLRDMVPDGRYPWMMVDPRWKEDPHPQERLKPKEDPVTLRRAAPQHFPLPTAPVLTLTKRTGSFSDNFNRANASLTTPWNKDIFGGGDLQVISNQLGANNASLCIGTLKLADIGITSQDVVASVTITHLNSSGSDTLQFFLRLTSTTQYYSVSIQHSAGFTFLFVQRFYNGSSQTLINSQSMANLNVNDVVQVSVIGTRIAVSVNAVEIAHAIDAVIASGTYFGIRLGSASGSPEAFVDSFTLAAAADQSSLTWTNASCPASVITAYQIYRAVDGAAFALLNVIDVVPDIVTGLAAPNQYLDTPLNFGAHSYVYEVKGLAAQAPDSPYSNQVSS